MKLRILSLLLISAMLLSCSATRHSSVSSGNENDKLLIAVSWYQQSAELTALFYQGFNIAQERLDAAVAGNTSGKPLAVIVDIDETMLDNSPFESEVINSRDDISGWYKWTAKASARALPGALEFAEYAQSKGVEIFYVTNRDDKEREVTLRNLNAVKFPFATEDHLLTRSDLSYSTGNTSSKKGRRAIVAENYNVILLIGDNLNDFSEIFEDRRTNNGKDAVVNNRELFGQKFIILPNPMYGAWEKPLYNYNNKLSNAEKTKLLKDKLVK